MDPLSITTGSIQIVHLCARNTISLARWAGKFQTIDEQVNDFCNEIKALSATYEALNNSLRSSTYASAAQTLGHNSGNRLWQQQSHSIKDCEHTMLALNNILNNFSADLGNPYRRGHEQFGESMNSGDIARLRQRIQLFDAVLALPLQMMKLNIQSERRGESNQLKEKLKSKINSLNITLSWLITMLQHYSQLTDTYVSSNWTYQDDRTVCDHLNGCIDTAQMFLSATTTASTTASNTKVRPDAIITNSEGGARPRRAVTWEAGDSLTLQESSLASWVLMPTHDNARSEQTLELHSPLDPVSRIGTTQESLGDNEELGCDFGWAHHAIRQPQTSLLDDPFEDITTPGIVTTRETYSIDPLLLEIQQTEKPRAATEAKTPAHHEAMLRFATIRRLCSLNDHEKAISEAIDFLKCYTPGSHTIPHALDIESNILHGAGLGLAATGHGYAALHFFVSLPAEQLFEVELLIDHGVDVNATLVGVRTEPRSRPPCQTALQLAAERGHAKITKLLAETPGIDLEAENSRSLTALFIAWRKGHLKVVEILLSNGAISTGSPDVWHGNSLLHGAAWLCNVDIVALLLERGADVNARNAIGSTPLIAAVISTDIADPRLRRMKLANCTAVMRLLLARGADFRLKNNEGYSAMHYAEREHNLDVVALLEGRGARRTIGEAHPLHPHDVVGNLFRRVLTSGPTKPQLTAPKRSRTMSA